MSVDAIAHAGGSAVSLESLFRRLFAALRHASPHHRLGASLAWGHVYRTFREDETLVSRYAFLVLDNLLVALRLSAADGSQAVGTAT
jgi:hypothetical protein